MQCMLRGNALTLVAQNDNDHSLLYAIRKSFYENGSVEINVRNHAQNAQCLDCEAAKKYRDCIKHSANFSKDVQQKREHGLILYPFE